VRTRAYEQECTYEIYAEECDKIKLGKKQSKSTMAQAQNNLLNSWLDENLFKNEISVQLSTKTHILQIIVCHTEER
jgi:hypothetical protein